MWGGFFVIHLPILLRHSQEKTLTVLQYSCWGGFAGMPCTHVSSVHFLNGRDGYCCTAKHMVLWKLCRDEPAQMTSLYAYERTDLQLSLLWFSKWKIGHYVMCEDHYHWSSHEEHFTFQRLKRIEATHRTRQLSTFLKKKPTSVLKCFGGAYFVNGAELIGAQTW